MVRNRVRTNGRADRQCIVETLALREQAAGLLRRLLESREQSERRMAELGRRDPLKSLTGRSALDEAVANTRAMLASMDELLHEMEEELEREGAPHPDGGLSMTEQLCVGAGSAVGAGCGA
jgi:hypothetical protein